MLGEGGGGGGYINYPASFTGIKAGKSVRGTQDLAQSLCLDKTMYKHILVDTVCLFV